MKDKQDNTDEHRSMTPGLEGFLGRVCTSSAEEASKSKAGGGQKMGATERGLLPTFQAPQSEPSVLGPRFVTI